jgi:hypothetical protein
MCENTKALLCTDFMIILYNVLLFPLSALFEKASIAADAFFLLMKGLKILKNTMDNFVLSQKWTKRFFASHLFGWAVAFLQTFWIVYEIRKFMRKQK